MIIVMKWKHNAHTVMYVHTTQTRTLLQVSLYILTDEQIERHLPRLKNRQTHTSRQINRQANSERDAHIISLTKVAAWMSAPFSSRSLTTSKSPLSAAQCRAVLPSWYQYQCDNWIIIINIVIQLTAL